MWKIEIFDFLILVFTTRLNFTKFLVTIWDELYDLGGVDDTMSVDILRVDNPE